MYRFIKASRALSKMMDIDLAAMLRPISSSEVLVDKSGIAKLCDLVGCPSGRLTENFDLLLENQQTNPSGWCFRTMEFYDFPETLGNVITPTDELHDFSEGLGFSHQPETIQFIQANPPFGELRHRVFVGWL